jgi:hypothetical protein
MAIILDEQTGSVLKLLIKEHCIGYVELKSLRNIYECLRLSSFDTTPELREQYAFKTSYNSIAIQL